MGQERFPLGMVLQMASEAPPQAAMRAPTWSERLTDAVRDTYERLAEQPLFRLADLLGFTDIAGVARELNTPNTGMKLGMMPDGPGKALKAATKGIRAFHGSPHEYAAERLIEWPNGKQEYLVGKPDLLPDLPEGAKTIQEFPLGRQRMDKIGTGEGAQAYGHGLYQGGVADTARGYRDSVGAAHAGGMHTYDPELKINGRRIEDVYASIDRNAARLPNEAASKEYAKLEILEDLGHEGDVLAIRERAKDGSYSPEALAWFEKEVAPKFTRKGRLYEVRIHADPEDFLDWDAPLSQQSKKVRKRVLAQLKPNKIERYMMGGGQWQPPPRENMTGREAIQHIQERLREEGMHGPLAAQLDLLGKNKKGIPGIKYLDGVSRAKGEGSRNYVVFDDKLIEIVKKYGIAGALASGLINESQARQMREQGYP